MAKSSEREKAKQVICGIILASHNRLVGKTKLFKAFYAAHLFYWRDNKGTLTNYPIVRMPHGPGIHEGDTLLKELENDGRIRTSRNLDGPYPEWVFETVKAVKFNPADPGFQAIEQAAKWIENKSAAELSQETHENSRSWNKSSEGEILNIYLDLLDESEYEKVQKGLEETEAALSGIFGR